MMKGRKLREGWRRRGRRERGAAAAARGEGEARERGGGEGEGEERVLRPPLLGERGTVERLGLEFPERAHMGFKWGSLLIEVDIYNVSAYGNRGIN